MCLWKVAKKISKTCSWVNQGLCWGLRRGSCFTLMVGIIFSGHSMQMMSRQEMKDFDISSNTIMSSGLSSSLVLKLYFQCIKTFPKIAFGAKSSHTFYMPKSIAMESLKASPTSQSWEITGGERWYSLWATNTSLILKTNNTKASNSTFHTRDLVNNLAPGQLLFKVLCK